ncbi:MSC_0882 family membrane protein [Mycoplasma sp. Ms02]|uniref:MSC_0882 family membrane protein n=1 Tax=Mycoplasma sp. Ms02 TaxID=353851 RepID=UPI001C89CD65|nr:hypothetical protein [Mycoplasma sp. Ms02]QZE12188.1 hypothetical protein K4L35_02490 [Mycoplasma sp. Ms02]
MNQNNAPLKPIEETITIEYNERKVTDLMMQQNRILYRDPQGQLPAVAHAVVRKEKTIRKLSLLFSVITLFAGFLGILISILTSPTFPVGWVILFGIILIYSIVSLIKNFFDLASWNRTTKSIRDSYSEGNDAARLMFHRFYRQLIMKHVRMAWGLLFIVTFFGAFLLITWLLYYSFVLKEKHTFEIRLDSLDTSLNINFEKILGAIYNNNTGLMLILSAISLTGLILGYILLFAYDKKRMLDFTSLLGEKSHEIYESVQKSKEKKNKFYFKIYLLTVFAVFFLPLLLILLLVWKKIVRRK